MDVPALEVITSIEFTPVPEVPFEFCLGGLLTHIPQGPYPEGENYSIQVDLRQRLGSSTVGDILGVYAHAVELPTHSERLVVTALEDCDAEKSPHFSPGGYCITKEY